MTKSLFGQVEAFAGDPILSLNDSFKADPRTEKVNLSIGVYTDENGRIPVLGCGQGGLRADRLRGAALSADGRA